MKFHLEDIKSKYILFFIAFLISGTLVAQNDIPKQPKPIRIVNDLAGLLSSREKNNLERKLVRYNDTSSNQIAVLTVKSFNGYDITEFADRIGEEWGVGRKGLDNGILILMKPKTRESRGQVRISVGYGLESVVTDALSKRIIEKEMIPEFRKGNTYMAFEKATNVLMKASSKEFNSDKYMNKGKATKKGIGVGAGFIIFMIYMVLSLLGRRRTYGGGGSSGLWTALFLGSMMSGGRSGGSWSNFSGGSGSFGGGSSFGGFGGGSFGGGGASGSW